MCFNVTCLSLCSLGNVVIKVYGAYLTQKGLSNPGFGFINSKNMQYPWTNPQDSKHFLCGCVIICKKFSNLLNIKTKERKVSSFVSNYCLKILLTQADRFLLKRVQVSSTFLNDFRNDSYSYLLYNGIFKLEFTTHNNNTINYRKKYFAIIVISGDKVKPHNVLFNVVLEPLTKS